jgi:RNA methyltransferase, TrmH family
MTVSPLTSKDNPLLKTIRLIVSGSRRAPVQLAAAEGIRVLEEVNRIGCEIKAVVVAEHFGSTAREKKLLASWLSRGIPTHTIGEKLFQSVSDVQTPQGAIALIKVPKRTLNDIVLTPHPLILCACEIQDPGNLGTLIRAAAAAGASFVCTSKGTVSAKNPKAIRSSAGAFFRLPLVEHSEPSDFRKYCEAHSIQLYRTDTRRGMPYTEADLLNPCAILVGNEGSGMKEDAFAAASAIHIPMAEGAESLNVAMAGSIILFEAFRQRKKQQNAGSNAADKREC